MLGNLSGVHLIAILAVVLLLFGAPKLPGLAKSIGQSMKILKKEVGGGDEPTEATAAGTAAAPAPAASTVAAPAAAAPVETAAAAPSPAEKKADAA